MVSVWTESASIWMHKTVEANMIKTYKIVSLFTVSKWITLHTKDYDTSPWRHNERDGVSNHRRLDCVLNRFFRRRSTKTTKRRTTGLCEGNSHTKGPVTWKMFQFDDVIMALLALLFHDNGQFYHIPFGLASLVLNWSWKTSISLVN